jgi:hypothetical protein
MKEIKRSVQGKSDDLSIGHKHCNDVAIGRKVWNGFPGRLATLSKITHG